MLGHGSVMKFMTKPGRPKQCAKFNQGNDFGDIDRLIAATSIRTAKKTPFQRVGVSKAVLSRKKISAIVLGAVYQRNFNKKLRKWREEAQDIVFLGRPRVTPG